MKFFSVITMYLIFVFSIQKLESQIINQDSYIKLTGYINTSDSQLVIQIENISNSTLIFCTEDMTFKAEYTNPMQWSAVIGFEEPNKKINFKRSMGEKFIFQYLKPKETLAVFAYELPFLTNNCTSDIPYKLFVNCEYLISVDYCETCLTNDIIYMVFLEQVRYEGLSVKSLSSYMKIGRKEENCRLILESE
jgi:hypothetical protein